MFFKYKMLKVGTDCSGIEAPIEALKQLKIPFRHVFSSEIDKYCIQSIKANYNPEIIFGDKNGAFPEGDITKRNIKDVPDIDLYVCGFPCQPFSSAGERKGLDDDRGTVFFSCLEVIKKKQPKYFILENVKGLLSHDKGNTFEIIWKNLLKLEKDGYKIKWKILNTRDYGIPQNRERLFIVGCKNKDFVWPVKKKMKNLKDFVDWKDIIKYDKKTIKNIPKNSIFIDLNFFREHDTYPNAYRWSPCLNTQNGLWNVPIHRFANVKERLNLQGFPKTFKKVVSKTQINKQIGNSMSVNVLKEIMKQLL